MGVEARHVLPKVWKALLWFAIYYLGGGALLITIMAVYLTLSCSVTSNIPCREIEDELSNPRFWIVTVPFWPYAVFVGIRLLLIYLSKGSFF